MKNTIIVLIVWLPGIAAFAPYDVKKINYEKANTLS